MMNASVARGALMAALLISITGTAVAESGQNQSANIKHLQALDDVLGMHAAINPLMPV